MKHVTAKNLLMSAALSTAFIVSGSMPAAAQKADANCCENQQVIYTACDGFTGLTADQAMARVRAEMAVMEANGQEMPDCFIVKCNTDTMGPTRMCVKKQDIVTVTHDWTVVKTSTSAPATSGTMQFKGGQH